LFYHLTGKHNRHLCTLASHGNGTDALGPYWVIVLLPPMINAFILNNRENAIPQ